MVYANSCSSQRFKDFLALTFKYVRPYYPSTLISNIPELNNKTKRFLKIMVVMLLLLLITMHNCFTLSFFILRARHLQLLMASYSPATSKASMQFDKHQSHQGQNEKPRPRLAPNVFRPISLSPGSFSSEISSWNILLLHLCKSAILKYPFKPRLHGTAKEKPTLIT